MMVAHRPAGGLLARTDACKDLAHLKGCRLVLKDLSVQGNSAMAGGGLLLTNISSSVVEMQSCTAGSALNDETAKACLSDNINGVTRRFFQESSRRRLLLAESLTNTATSGGHLLVTSAASMTCGSMADTASSEVRMESCDTSLTAAPGLQFNPLVQLWDGLGRPVQTGIYDANMPMQVRSAGQNPSRTLVDLRWRRHGAGFAVKLLFICSRPLGRSAASCRHKPPLNPLRYAVCIQQAPTSLKAARHCNFCVGCWMALLQPFSAVTTSPSMVTFCLCCW
jgi:hypothetical protein